jgi:hypothetical protein
MEIINMESKAYKRLIDKIEELEKEFKKVAREASRPLGEKWLDNQDVCVELNISMRTLSYYRERGELPYAIIRHKIFYKESDINKFMMKHYHSVKGF